MKKSWLTILLVLAMLFPLLWQMKDVLPLKATDNDKAKTQIIDNTIVRAEVSYEESATQLHWRVDFTKKKSETATRIRFAIDTTSEISRVTGTGLKTAGDTLETLNEDGLKWYYGTEYSPKETTGTLQFTTANHQELKDQGVPLKIAADDAPAALPLAAVEARVLPAARLGPTSSRDPYNYIYTDETDNQRRYPKNPTNYYIGADNDPFILGEYTGTKGSIYKNGVDGEPVEDMGEGAYDKGGANWRNYNYVRDNGSTATEEDVGERAKTVQAWGTPAEHNFVNSYLDYNGAYIKKWVEPITDHVDGNQDKTTVYNVYLDVIGGYADEPQPLDIVFVLDKSSSMVEEIATGVTKDKVLIDSVEAISRQLLEDRNLDVRIGMVNFRGYPKDKIASDVMAMTRDYADVTDAAKNPALNYKAQSGTDATPMTLGLQQGYELLYKDNGGTERNPEKILIVIGDGTPTYSYSGFRRIRTSDLGNNTADTAWSNSWSGSNSYWTNDSTTNPLFRDYETGYGSFGSSVRYPTEFDVSKRPANTGTYTFGFGEVTGTTDATTQWFGTGNTSNETQTKANAIQTVAYHHWLRNQYAAKDIGVPKVYTVGLGLATGSSTQAQVDSLGRNVLKNIADLKNGNRDEPYYYSADNSNDLLQALRDISGEFIKTISRAVLYDDVGKNVSIFDGGTDADIEFFNLELNDDPANPDIKYKEPEPWDEAKHGLAPEKVTATPILGSDGHAYTFDPISLGEGEMVRIKYQVKLDGSKQNGLFYTVSNEAYIQNERDFGEEDKKMFFPAPSIRYQHDQRNLQIQKSGPDGEGIQGVTFALYAEDPSLNPDAVPLETTETTQDGRAQFEQQFDTDSDSGLSDKYWLKEIDGPAWYQLLDEVLYFQVARVKATSVEQPIGHYELVENETSGTLKDFAADSLWGKAHFGENYVLSLKQTVTETSSTGYVWDELYVNLDITNEYKPLQLTIEKLLKDTAIPLEDVEFSLYRELSDGSFEEDAIAKGVTNPQGQLQFFTLDNAGDMTEEPYLIELAKGEEYTGYKIVETRTPNGLIPPETTDYWQLRLHEDGNITYRQAKEDKWQTTHLSDDKVEAANDAAAVKFTLTIENELVPRSIQVQKVDETGAALNGVGFNLWRLDDDGSRESPYRAYSGITYDPDGQLVITEGSGTFYNWLSDVGKYVDQNLERPLILRPGRYEIEEVETPIGYKGRGGTFAFTLTIDGRFTTQDESGQVVPLPPEFSFDDEAGVLTLTVENQTLPFALEIEKVDRWDKNKPVPGAKFSIRQQSPDGTWGAAETMTVDEDGSLFTKAPLAPGVYKITEDKAPNGYQALAGHLELTIAKRTTTGTNQEGLPNIGEEQGALYAQLRYFNEAGAITDSEDLTLALTAEDTVSVFFKVTNDPKNTLPKTGGSGRQIYFVIAALVFAALGLLALWNRRLNRREAD